MARKSWGTSRGKKKNIQPRKQLVVVCEGQNTEPAYFDDLVADFRNPLVSIKIVGGAGVPITVVERCVDEKNALTREARKQGNSFDALFEVWGVVDVDEHPRLLDAVALAEKNKIRLCISNPCFEVWPLLHLCEHNAPDPRETVQKKLGKLMPEYDHGSGAKVDYAQIKEFLEDAGKRAVRQRVEQEKVRTPYPEGNPSTLCDKLVAAIAEGGMR